MRMTRKIWIQITIFLLVSTIAGAIMVFNYMGLPNLLFGVGHYRVTLQLPEAGGLYARGNVTYRGTEVGRVEDVTLTNTGVDAKLSLRSDIKIPADLDAQVHSVSAVGEQYVALLPRSGNGPALKEGDVIPVDRTFVPPDINSLLDATNRGLQAIPHDNLKTVVDEGYTAVGGLGPDISRFVKGSTALAIDARKNLDSLTTLIDQSKPVLDTQTDTSDAVTAWASHLATISGELKSQDQAVAGVINKGSPAADEVRALFDRLQPTLPIVLANLVSLGQVAVTYQPNLEQLLVLLPQGAAVTSATGTANRHQTHTGAYLDFNLNLNLPPPCNTGYLPPQQQRVPADQDYPDPPAGDLYCRVPQDSVFNVRGARNIPCETVPGKRAPTVKMCESTDVYQPLNDGFNWKGDPNATLSGQPIPQLPPGTPPAQGAPPPAQAPPPIAAAEYDPATGTYVGPDGKVYTQANLADNAKEEQTWQTMLLPPKGN
jgi:phospholipid/cholesterol/gamma-HCH transport system substrate-binding protein